MKHRKAWLLAILWAALIAIGAQAQAAPTFFIQTAPIFADADSGGANPITGSFGTIFSESFNFGTPTNTGPLADYDSTLPLNFGLDFWIKSEAGNHALGKQMVIQLEGADNGFNGGMFDIMNNVKKHDKAQPAPAGKEFYSDRFRIGVNDIPFASEPSVLTNSRIQNYVTFGGYDPATETLDPNSANWHNILDDFSGFPPVIHTSFDANGLDIYFEFAGAGYWADALEDQAVRLVTFYNGDLPGSDGDDNGGGGSDDGGDGGGGASDIPEPATFLLLGLGILGVSAFRKKMTC